MMETTRIQASMPSSLLMKWNLKKTATRTVSSLDRSNITKVNGVSSSTNCCYSYSNTNQHRFSKLVIPCQQRMITSSTHNRMINMNTNNSNVSEISKYFRSSSSRLNHRRTISNTSVTKSQEDSSSSKVKVSNTSASETSNDHDEKVKNDDNGACGTVDDNDEMEQEEMFVDPHDSFEFLNVREWNGPRRGGRLPEPTRYGDWERKGRCTDF